jgi:three-Cys-motif partner protein
MSGVEGTLWKLDQHTSAKHAILRRYLQAWYPILGSKYKRIIYIDGFAGPGEYMNGEEGSPVIAIKTAVDHILNLKMEILFLFIEKHNDRFDHLNGILSRMEIPDNFNYRVLCDRFDAIINHELDNLDAQNEYTVPFFTFIDPFGYKDTPFSIVKRIMSYRSSEILITFMSGFVNRFKNEEQFQEDISLLYGDTNWNYELSNNNHKSTEKAIIAGYLKRLSSVATHVRSFEMKNKFNQPIYHLVFATNSYDGLKKMKESMWSVDKSGQFSYSDTTDPHQSVLFEQEPDFSALKRMIVDEFNGREAQIQDIEKYVVINTPYRESHYKRILKEMEKANPPALEVIKCKPDRKKGTYNDPRMVLRFIPRHACIQQIKDCSKPKYQDRDLSSFFK